QAATRSRSAWTVRTMGSASPGMRGLIAQSRASPNRRRAGDDPLFYLLAVAATATLFVLVEKGRSVRRAEGDMTLAEARAILGVGPRASALEVRAAYARAMRAAHPDAGGAHDQAARLNAARERLERS